MRRGRLEKECGEGEPGEAEKSRDEDLEMEEEQDMDSRCMGKAVGGALGVCLAGSRLKPPCDG